jgi:sugar/nucleoside kinase (ribokinase family)
MLFMVDFAAIGHVVIDTIIKQDQEWTFIAGPVVCIYVVADKLGKKVQPITKVGDDIPYELQNQLDEMGFDVSKVIVKGAKTTKGLHDLRGEERQSKLINYCEKLKPEDVRDLPNAVLVDPALGEVPWETLIEIDSEIIALDAQGFVREALFENVGTNLLSKWSDHGFLERIDIFKSTEDEIKVFTQDDNLIGSLRKIIASGPEIAFATQGSNGAVMIFGDKGFMIPVYEINKIDDMGAGDAFISGFFCEFLDDRDPLWCASMGAAMSASILETIGMNLEISQSLVKERAEDVYNRIAKISI